MDPKATIKAQFGILVDPNSGSSDMRLELSQTMGPTFDVGGLIGENLSHVVNRQGHSISNPGQTQDPLLLANAAWSPIGNPSTSSSHIPLIQHLRQVLTQLNEYAFWNNCEVGKIIGYENVVAVIVFGVVGKQYITFSGTISFDCLINPIEEMVEDWNFDVFATGENGAKPKHFTCRNQPWNDGGMLQLMMRDIVQQALIKGLSQHTE